MSENEGDEMLIVINYASQTSFMSLQVDFQGIPYLQIRNQSTNI